MNNTKRALKDFRFSHLFGAIRRLTSSRRRTIAHVRSMYKSMELEHRGCTLCGARNFTLLAQSDRYGFDLDKQICIECGLVQTMPALPKEFLDIFYRDYYRRLYTKAENVDYSKLLPEQVAKGVRFKTFLQNNLVHETLNDLSIVEIGCSSGGILSVFAKDAKTVQGSDLDVEAIAFAKSQFGFDLEVASFPSKVPNGPKVIILSHVLEHVHQPREFLNIVRNMMTKDDYLLIEVPGLNAVAEGAYGYDLWAYFHIAHVSDFTAGTLNALASVSGFEVIKCDETVTALLRISTEDSLPWKKSPIDTVENVIRVANIQRTTRQRPSH